MTSLMASAWNIREVISCGKKASSNSTVGSRSVSVTRFSVTGGFLNEFIKVLPVVGCVIVVGCCDVVIPV